MTPGMKPEGDDRPRHNHTDAAGAIALDYEALLDHHLEELLGAFSDLKLVRILGPAD